MTAALLAYRANQREEIALQERELEQAKRRIAELEAQHSLLYTLQLNIELRQFYCIEVVIVHL